MQQSAGGTLPCEGAFHLLDCLRKNPPPGSTEYSRRSTQRKAPSSHHDCEDRDFWTQTRYARTVARRRQTRGILPLSPSAQSSSPGPAIHVSTYPRRHSCARLLLELLARR